MKAKGEALAKPLRDHQSKRRKPSALGGAWALMRQPLETEFTIMQTFKLSGLQYVALGLGAGWLGLQTMQLLEHAGQATWTTKALVPAATITLAALPVLFEHTIGKRQWAGAAGLAVLFVLLLAYSLPYAIARSGEARDMRTAQVTAYQSAVTKAEKAKADADKECRSGNGPKCKDARAEQSKAEAKVPAVQPVANADAVRVASLFNIDVASYEKFQPMALPLANEVGVWLLLWLGLSPSLMVAVKTKTTKRRRKVTERQLPLRLVR